MTSTHRVLIYRLGSLGDTVVALPCFHLIARAFPAAERRVLTNFPVSQKEPPLAAVLGESGLVHSYMEYPRGLRDPRSLLELRARIMAWRPEILVYLAAPRGRLKAVRDALFFSACGIRTLIGVPYTGDLQANRRLDGTEAYEPEAARLVRCVGPLGDAALGDPGTWDLLLSPREIKAARHCLDGWPGSARFLACSVGTKVDVKDWGLGNWRRLLRDLSRLFQGYGLVLMGAADEAARSEIAGREWSGPVLNLCGGLTPRESAAVLRQAVLFVGHDGGPMHLAAAVGVPCVAIFSARNKPGVWFPHGSHHRVIYHKVPCFDCRLEVCERYQKRCITSITVEEVVAAVEEVMAGGGGHARGPAAPLVRT